MARSKGPTNEAGAVTASGLGLVPWGSFIDDSERAPELLWPSSVETYFRMTKDAQVNALIKGTVLPITRYRWMIDPNGASDAVVRKLAEDLNLPVKGDDSEQPHQRSKNRFNFHKHLKSVLVNQLTYGHDYYEQVGVIDEDGWWRLRKLAPRPARTITDIKVARDGGLVSIKQDIGINQAAEIPVDRLVAYVLDAEPGSWIGTSALRFVYKHYLRKDRLLRVDAIKHERNGMGHPVVKHAVNATRAQIRKALAAARKAVTGLDSGMAMPEGSDIEFKGVQGTIPDTIASIRYDDESMARSFLMMFAVLGQTQTGSRALGDTFEDFFALGQEAYAKEFAMIFNEHVIEDWCDWNVGENELAPLLVFERNEDPELSVADIVSLINAGALDKSDAFIQWIHDKYNLPEPRTAEERAALAPPAAPSNPSEAQTPPEGTPEPVQAGKRASEAVVASAVRFALPDRELRRQPYEHEVRAEVDYAALELLYINYVDELTALWNTVRNRQIEELANEIEAAKGDLNALSEIQASVEGAPEISSRLQALAKEAADAVVAEAKAQGLTIPAPDLAVLEADLLAQAEALATTLTRDLSGAAARAAIARTGGSLTAAEVAASVSEYLSEFSDAYLRKEMQGIVSTAINQGRTHTFSVNESDYAEFYASEILDGNTCTPCSQIDGKKYTSMKDVWVDYPSRGYVGCLGGNSCRGTAIGIAKSETEKVK